MRVAFITRSTLYKVPGGDTEQIIQTARCLKNLGVRADIHLTNEQINYDHYDLLHFSNIIRPSDILYHTYKSNKPFVISPNFVDYSEYDKEQRKGISGFIFHLFSSDFNEYLKTISRWLLGTDVLKSKSYLRKGHKRSVREILKRTALLLPTSKAEFLNLKEKYSVERPYSIVPNGVDAGIFIPNGATRNNHLVLCAARIEGIKNQLNLIRALNNSEFTLMIVGEPAPNQKKYFQRCRSIAGVNIIFAGKLSHEELAKLYKKAKVHVLPSWFETCGLSTLEAAAMGCNLVITDKGYTREYFGDEAFYCDPSDPKSILDAVRKAADTGAQKSLQEKILDRYTWRKAAEATLEAYKKIIPD